MAFNIFISVRYHSNSGLISVIPIFLSPAILSVLLCISFGNFLVDATNRSPYGIVSTPSSNNPFFYPFKSMNSPGIVLSSVLQPAVLRPAAQDQPPLPTLSTSRALPDLVRDFASYFIQEVDTDQRVKTAFAFHRLTVDNVAQIFHDISAETQRKLGNLDPEGTAGMLAEAIRRNFERVDTDYFIAAAAYTTGMLLFDHDALNPDNVAYYAQKYFQIIRDRVNSIVVPSPSAELKAVLYAYEDFVSTYGLIRPDNALMPALIFASEWYSL